MSGKLSVANARKTCSDILQAKDRSSFVISRYIPSFAQDSVLALRTFNVETAKVVDSATERDIAKIRLEFWKSAVQFPKRTAGEEPVTTLLANSTSQCPIHKRYLLTMLQTRETRLKLAPMRNVQDMERYGEGIFSQMLYATFDALQSSSPETTQYLADHPELDEMISDSLAHIGQATGISSLLRGFQFYASRHHYLNLPVDVLASNNISEQSVLDGQLPLSELKDAVFTVATAANDHILTAKHLIKNLASETGRVPTNVLVTVMNLIPVQLYLERLEQNDFDLGKPVSEWKLPWRSWRAYRTKTI